ncbi:hypothetical protein [Paludisphaera mucosa]|uniref:Uncharacterized protein n=1 Tax=Paludisphaera mucosa TaxID=3030827 RepID=A0ABT6FDX8_9BACT|nr:hypothetical protein [Paludisphaera mucosa]MDG3005783.1 hypothetical protein [Paludisphaera mucosa]
MTWSQRSPRRRPDRASQRLLARPAIEVCEDRILLTAFLVLNGDDAGPGSLRDVIQQANADASAPHTIAFDPAVTTIDLLSALDPIQRQVTINSTSRTDVAIDGGGGSFDGLTLAAGSDGSTVQFLTIRDFGGAGVRVRSSGDQILGNTLGADSEGLGEGVFIEGGANNIIGAAGSANVIGFTTVAGVLISGSTAAGNVVRANLIGADASNVARGNPIGVLINQAGSNTIGGSAAGSGNVIGNSATAAVQVLDSTAASVIAGNFIGMDASGAALGNVDGVQVFRSANVVVGGDAGDGNFIGNSSHAAVSIAGLGATGNTVLGNTIGFTPGSGVAASNAYGVVINDAAGNTIGGTTLGSANHVDASTLVGVQIFGPSATGNTILGNDIGSRGNDAISANEFGIQLNGAGGNTIGGTTSQAANTIGNSKTAGVQILGPKPAGDLVIGNRIGVGEANSAVGNLFGVQVVNSNDDRIGGTAPGEANLIGFNIQAGVSIFSGVRNLVQHNQYVGTNGALPGASSDINLAPTANGAIQPPAVSTASILGSDLTIRFSQDLVAGDVIEVYLFDPSLPGSRSFLDQGVIVAGSLDALTIPAGSLSNGQSLVVTATSATGTSAFSSVVLIADLLTVTNTFDSGSGSLHQAILNANALGGGNIVFAIPVGSTIDVPASLPLPTITARVAFAAIAADLLAIQGDGSIFDGFVFGSGSDDSLIENLTIRGFGGAGVRILSSDTAVQGDTFDANGVGVVLAGATGVVAANFFGTEAGVGNGVGVLIQGPDNTLGGETLADANFIIRSSIAGVQISGPSATGDKIFNNAIGHASDPALSNAVGVMIVGAGGNFVGDVGKGNTIRNNRQQGVSVQAGDQNTILSNVYIANGGDDASSIFIAPGANSGLLPLDVLSAARDADALSIQATVAPGQPVGGLSTLEIYQFRNGTGVLIQTVTGVSLVAGTQTIDVTAPGIDDADPILITITSAAGDTSAFSNPVRAVPPTVVVNTNDFGLGSLRNAIEYLNTHPDETNRTITFDLSRVERSGDFWVIPVIDGPLVVLLPMVIDAWGGAPSTDGFEAPEIRLRPQAAAEPPPFAPFQGLIFGGDSGGQAHGYSGSVVQGLGFDGFFDAAVTIETYHVTVRGNDFVGATEGGAFGVGVRIAGGFQNLVGGALESEGNHFGSLEVGVLIEGRFIEGQPPSEVASHENQVVGNRFGTDGFEDFGNTYGVFVSQSFGNKIAANWIGNSEAAGIEISGPDATLNLVTANFIGVVPTRSVDYKPGNFIGILIDGAGWNFIGRSTDDAGNVLLDSANVIGNNGVGIEIDGAPTEDSTPAAPLATSQFNTVAGNYIGADALDRDLGNGIGVAIRGGAVNFVGLRGDVWANVIGNSTNEGVLVDLVTISREGSPSYTIPAVGNVLQNNFLGTNPDGTSAPNTYGVRLASALGNVVGPPSGSVASTLLANVPDGANVISANRAAGVFLGAGSANNFVQGNLIGRAATLATAPFPGVFFAGNLGSGVVLAGGFQNVIGGLGALPAGSRAAGFGNLILGNLDGVDVDADATSGDWIRGNQISGSLLNGIAVQGDLGGATRILTIAENFIGTSFDGLTTRSASGEPTANGLNGIQIAPTGTWSPALQIADPAATPVILVASNLISGNGLSGVAVSDPIRSNASTLRYAKVLIDDNIVGLNLVGDATDAAGTPFGNVLDGVRIANAGGVQVGKAPTIGDPRSNVLSGNLGRGLEVAWTKSLPTFADAGDDFDVIGAMKIAVLGNVIGADLAGASASRDGRSTGNLSDGVFLLGNVVTVVQSNLVGGNRASGIHAAGVEGGFTGWLFIDGDDIGTNTAGADLYNGSDGVFLDGLEDADTSQVRVQIRGNNIGANRANGVQVLASRGVAITGNRIGAYGLIAGLAGAQELGNFSNGVFLNGSTGVTVGGTSEADRNIISGNRGSGVVINGSPETASGGNFILGNFIGASADGLRSVPNQNSGILVNGSAGNRIGTATAVVGENGGNLISGNRLYGVLIAGAGVGANGNSVAGNLIGTNRGGTAALPNSSDGVFILNAAGNMIGGLTASRNVISGNDAQGVRIFGAASIGNVIAGDYIGVGSDGRTAIGNQGNGVIIDNSGPNQVGPDTIVSEVTASTQSTSEGRNVISGNGQSGVQISGTTVSAAGTRVFNNFIGVDATASFAVPNRGPGVVLSGVSGVVVGSDFPVLRNIISGNGQGGVSLVSSQGGAPATRIIGNIIGLDGTGTTAIGNNGNGVALTGVSDVEVSGNVVSGNAFDGVQVFSPSSQAFADGNRIFGNYIGTNGAGSAGLGNRGGGVVLINGHGNVVGGVAANVISGNVGNGVDVEFQAGREREGNAAPNTIAGNLIGLDAGGSRRVGNGLFGVLLDNAVDTVVGYAAGGGVATLPGTLVPAAGAASNVISGNGLAGIYLTGRTQGTTIRGNFIGVDAQGRAFNDAGLGLDLYSNLAGVLVDAQASGNWIGGLKDDESGPLEGTGNIITQSAAGRVAGLIGVRVNSTGAVGNHIQSNLIGVDSRGRSGSSAVGVMLDNAQAIQVGGFRPKQAGIDMSSPSGNVITGNATAGVEISGTLAQKNVVVGNFVGTDVTGTTRPAPRFAPGSDPRYNPSQADGVLILQGSGNVVGAPGFGNLISGNGNGVNIASLDANAPASSANLVVGNTIGTDVAGFTALPNFGLGVFITAAVNNTIQGNLISANGLAGVQIFGGRSQLGGAGTAVTLGNTILANQIGTNAAGQVDFSVTNGTQVIHSIADHPQVTLPDGIVVTYGFQQHGVVVIGSSGNQVGLPGLGNLISGNILTGVYISRLDNALNVFASPVGNSVQSNRLVFDGVYGVFRYDAPNGNPVAESPAANANDFTGTPIPIGDFVTGVDVTTPQTTTDSILLGLNTGRSVPSGPRRVGRRTQAASATTVPARPAALQRPVMAQAARVRGGR